MVVAVVVVVEVVVIVVVVMGVLYLTDNLNPVLDLNMTVANPQMTRIDNVAALPDGGAFVINHVISNRTRKVWRVNVRGQVIQHVYQCVRCYLSGLLVLNNNLYVIYTNGTLLQININNTKAVQVYQVPDVRSMFHYGSLSYHPSVITHPDLLLLADRRKDAIFSYNVTSKNKQVHLRLNQFSGPSSVSYIIYHSDLYYLVTAHNSHQVHVCNSTWGLYQTLGGPRGSVERQTLGQPWSAIGLPDGSIIISDIGNTCVSLFTIEGKFVRHLLAKSDGVSGPVAMSVSLPYLWLVDAWRYPINRLYRYKLY